MTSPTRVGCERCGAAPGYACTYAQGPTGRALEGFHPERVWLSEHRPATAQRPSLWALIWRKVTRRG